MEINLFKISSFVAVLCLMSISAVHAENPLKQRMFQDTSVPSTPPNPDQVIYEQEDFLPPGRGKVNRAGLKEMKRFNKEWGTLFEEVPNDVSGKKSKWYPQLQEAKKAFDKALQTGNQEDLFKIIPILADFRSRDWKSEPLNDRLEGRVNLWMEVCGASLIKAAAAYIDEHAGEVNADLLANFVKLFSVRGFFIAPNWEDEPLPINPGGLMIVNAAKVVTQLKAAPWEQSARFLGGNMTPTRFFEHYAADGDGLPVLKIKYAASKADIDAKFDELSAWVKQQEAQSQK